MRKTLLTILILVSFAPTLWAGGGATMMVVGGTAAAGGAAPPSYIVSESFDGASACGDGSHTNCDNTWTVAGDGTIDFNRTAAPAPLEGTNSLHIEEATTDTYIYISISAGSDPSAYVLMRPVTLSNVAAKYAIMFTNGATPLCVMGFNADGGDDTATVYARIGSTSGANAVTTINAGTTYHVWLDYSQTNDTCTLAFSTDGTKPTSGDNYSQATAAITTDANLFHLRSDVADNEFIFDKVRVDNVEISSNPQ